MSRPFAVSKSMAYCSRVRSYYFYPLLQLGLCEGQMSRTDARWFTKSFLLSFIQFPDTFSWTREKEEAGERKKACFSVSAREQRKYYVSLGAALILFEERFLNHYYFIKKERKMEKYSLFYVRIKIDFQLICELKQRKQPWSSRINFVYVVSKMNPFLVLKL